MGMEIYVVIGVMGGVVQDVAVLSNETRALEKRDSLDKEYGLERDKDDDHEHPENDVLLRTAILDD